jgi:hypothetical protein
MSGLRRDVRASVLARFADEPDRGERAATALEKVLDLELALMLGVQRRHARELDQRADRALFARRAEARAARARADAAAAAGCYLALLRRAREPAAVERWSGRLARALEAVVRSPEHALAAERAAAEPPRRVALSDVCARALEQVSVPARTEVVVTLDPPESTVLAHATPLGLAVVEMVQNAVNRDPAGSVRLAATALADGGLVVEVSDGGARWPDEARGVDEAVSAAGGVPLAFGELLTELQGGNLELVRPPGSGGGIRLRLRAVRPEGAES